MDNLRKCTYKEAYVKDGRTLYKEREGYFHQWGFTYEEFDNGAVQNSIAIVENIHTGKVHQAHPESVKFERR